MSTGQGLLGNNMFSYCQNKPVLYVDHSGFVIVLADDATDEQKQEYERAIVYIKTSETGRKLIDFLETSSEIITISFVDNDNMKYSYYYNTIFFDINSGLILGDGMSVQSAALGLAHEMGHAFQDISGLYNFVEGNQSIIERANLNAIEKPIAKELGEPIRNDYMDGKGVKKMENSTHFITTYTSPLPWWQYLLPWNWGKLRTGTLDHNMVD